MTIQFRRNGAPFRHAAGVSVQIGMKDWSSPESVLVAYTTATRPAADNSPYTATLDTDTSQMLAKFTAGVTYLDCSLEVKWETAPGSGAFVKTRRTKVRVDADTIRNTDASPSNAESPDTEWVAGGHAQSHDDGWKAQARSNIGALSSDAIGDAAGTSLTLETTSALGAFKAQYSVAQISFTIGFAGAKYANTQASNLWTALGFENPGTTAIITFRNKGGYVITTGNLSEISSIGIVGTIATINSQLGPASAAGVGARAFATDASSATFNATVTGGGSNKVPVFSDGSVWRVG